MRGRGEVPLTPVPKSLRCSCERPCETAEQHVCKLRQALGVHRSDCEHCGRMPGMTKPRASVAIAIAPNREGFYSAAVSIEADGTPLTGIAQSRDHRRAVAFALRKLADDVLEHGIPGVPDVVCGRCDRAHSLGGFALLPETYSGGALQHVDATDTEPAEVHEVRNCTCGSTIARRIS